MVTPFSVGFPDPSIRPPLAVFSVPPTMVEFSSVTMEPDPEARIVPPALLKVSFFRIRLPPAVASSFPALVVPLLVQIVRFWGWLASMVPPLWFTKPI